MIDHHFLVKRQFWLISFKMTINKDQELLISTLLDRQQGLMGVAQRKNNTKICLRLHSKDYFTISIINLKSANLLFSTIYPKEFSWMKILPKIQLKERVLVGMPFKYKLFITKKEWRVPLPSAQVVLNLVIFIIKPKNLVKILPWITKKLSNSFTTRNQLITVASGVCSRQWVAWVGHRKLGDQERDLSMLF